MYKTVHHQFCPKYVFFNNEFIHIQMFEIFKFLKNVELLKECRYRSQRVVGVE